MRIIFSALFFLLIPLSGLSAEENKPLEVCERRLISELDPTSFIYELQIQLKLAGYYEGKVDGIIGPVSCSALLQSLQNAGVADTGAVDGDKLLIVLPSISVKENDTNEASITLNDIAELPEKINLIDAELDKLRSENKYLLNYVRYLHAQLKKR